MASAVSNDLSNEDWLVMRARMCAKTDPYAAKAWMITARTLFPRNFNIQFEAYNLEKMGKNSKEAAKLLEGLYMSFPEEGKLWSEVHSLLEALQNDPGDAKNHFLTEILAAIPTHVQCQMLLSVADKISDKLEQCRLLLLAMRKFPDLVKEHGLKLVETLLTAEVQAQYQSPVNCYRKLLICDVLPLILQKGNKLTLSKKSLDVWLQKAVEFYISFVTQPASHEVTTPLSPDLMSPTKKSSRRMSIPGLQDKECQIMDPWSSLFKLLVLIGQRLSWEIEIEFFSKSREFQWQHILSLYNRSNQPGNESYNKQILYTTTVLFLECLYHYISSVDTDVFHTGGWLGGAKVSCIFCHRGVQLILAYSWARPAILVAGTGNSTPLVIIEGFKSEQIEDSSQPSASKKLKGESLLPHVHAADSVPNSQKVIQNFLTAFKCYELLHSSQELQREFITLCQAWRMETWSWMGHFQTDMFLYQGAFQDAVRHLQNYAIGSKTKLQIRHSLQLACCFYSLNNYSRACELILDVISALPETTSDPSGDPSENQFVHGTGRHLVLVPCTDVEIMPYCIQLLMTCFKDKAFSSKSADTSLGHLMVLLQYDWPKHEALFCQVIKKIQKQGSFIYNLFFNYITNVDILEEFAFLRTQEGGNVNLDILPVSTKLLAQQRTVTRGVNKGVIEDFKATLEKQIKRCNESVERIIRTFLTDERDFLLEAFL